MKIEHDMVVLFCPPLAKFPKQPEDISKCIVHDCPTCKKQMWFSEKKREIKKLAEEAEKKILLECHDCFEKRLKDNPEMIKDHVMVQL